MLSPLDYKVYRSILQQPPVGNDTQVEIFRDFPFDEFDIQVINVEAKCSACEDH